MHDMTDNVNRSIQRWQFIRSGGWGGWAVTEIMEATSTGVTFRLRQIGSIRFNPEYHVTGTEVKSHMGRSYFVVQ